MQEIIKNGDNIFTVIDFVPVGYQIWNIGKNAPAGYLPLCKPKDNSLKVETESLKAIKTEGAEIILAAIVGGQNTIESMEKYIKRYQRAKPGTYSYRQVQRMKAALPYMKQLKWN